jgi:hypothetical protein
MISIYHACNEAERKVLITRRKPKRTRSKLFQSQLWDLAMAGNKDAIREIFSVL